MMKYLVLFLCPFFALQADELLSIKNISTDRKRFVTSGGTKNGINQGQSGFFLSDTVNLKARAFRVSLSYTEWEVLAEHSGVPFETEQIVTYSPDPVMGLSFEKVPSLPRIQNLEFQLSYNQTVNESVSSVSSDATIRRVGLSFKALRNVPVAYGFVAGGGVRVDQEATVGKDFVAKSDRLMLLMAGTYHFLSSFASESHPYVGLELGAGISQTTQNDQKTAGFSLLAPGLKVGYEIFLTQDSAFQLEGALDNIFVQERLSDGSKQNSHLTNLRVGAGFEYFFE